MPRMIQTLLLLVVTVSTGFAQSWPVTLTMDNGDQVKVYEPKPEQFNSGNLQFQSAVALQKKDSDMPIFGNLWAKAQTSANGSNQVLNSLTVTGMRFPAEVDEASTRAIQSFIESALPSEKAAVKTADISSALAINKQKKELDAGFVNKAPKVYYRNKASMMVMIDGDAKFKRNDDWGMDAVVNSPNTILRYSSNEYYLYGGKHWYMAKNVDGPYVYDANPPAALDKVSESLAKNAAADTDKSNDYDSDFDNDAARPVAEVLVSHEPAELIQSNGEASFQPIDNTNLLYVENSPNDIFMDIATQQYYVLISGRWYHAASLSGNWTYTAADDLPADFAKIPAGTAKDNVLASVAGTPAAQNALMDAELPQTARVDRNSTPNQVTYDGTPEFQKISGTKMAYALNSSSTVIKYRNRYFLVENGVWFQSGNPGGPWEVSTVRPDEVDLIPPSYPVYNVKYVYVYDYTPDYVYMGYTPGYLNTYIYGPTVVYGTGWYYQPWWGNYYFPRPYTWGFNMHYNPWMGWSIGFNYSAGWFNYGWGYNPWSVWHGGWWGPSLYRPGYCWGGYRNYGYYGYRNNHFYVNNYYYSLNYQRGYGYGYNNIYRSRNHIYTRDADRYTSRPNRTPGRDYGVNRPNNRPGSDYGRNPSQPQVNNRGNLQRGSDPRMTDTRSPNDRFNNGNRGDNNRLGSNNRVTPNPGFSGTRDNTPQRRYAPDQRQDMNRSGDRAQQMDRQPSFERRPVQEQRQELDRNYQPQQQQQQRGFERREMPRQRAQEMQRPQQMQQRPQPQQRPQMQMQQQRSAPQMQRSAPSRNPGGFGGGGGNRGGFGGGSGRPERRNR